MGFAAADWRELLDCPPSAVLLRRTGGDGVCAVAAFGFEEKSGISGWMDQWMKGYDAVSATEFVCPLNVSMRSHTRTAMRGPSFIGTHSLSMISKFPFHAPGTLTSLGVLRRCLESVTVTP